MGSSMWIHITAWFYFYPWAYPQVQFVFNFRVRRWKGSQILVNPRCMYSRAGHATTLPRQRDHVFRPQNLLFVALYFSSLWLLHLDTETIAFLEFFLVTEAQLHCRDVAVTKLKNVACPALIYRHTASFFWGAKPSPNDKMAFSTKN